jgi:hypothetical protein
LFTPADAPQSAPPPVDADSSPDKAGPPPASLPPLPQSGGSLQFERGYYALANGPFSVDTLIQMVQSGEFTENSLVCTQGMARFAPAGTVAGLQPLFKDKALLQRFRFGFGIEAAGYSRQGIAPGAIVSAGFSFMPVLLAGITIGYFNNFGGLSTMEINGFLRSSINLEKCTLFVQGEGGIALFWEDTGMKSSYSAGGKIGVLIDLNRVKLGPYIRGGFPYLFAGGIVLSFSCFGGY